MSAGLRVRCRECGHVADVRFDTDGRGHLVELADWCDHQRFRRGICRDCWHPVEGKVGLAKRCRVHKAVAQRANQRRHYYEHREELLVRQRRRYHERMSQSPEIRERKRRLERAAQARRAADRRPRPVCATCGESIEYSGKGRPPKYHRTLACHPRPDRIEVVREARAAA